MEAGLDSLGAVELRNALTSRLGTELPHTITLDYPTISTLSEHIATLAKHTDTFITEQNIETSSLSLTEAYGLEVDLTTIVGTPKAIS